jgi:hypothetical protein
MVGRRATLVGLSCSLALVWAAGCEEPIDFEEDAVSAGEEPLSIQGRGRSCGGFGGISCPRGQTCVDDPYDSCDPRYGGADCGGVCVPRRRPGGWPGGPGGPGWEPGGGVGKRCGDSFCGAGEYCCNQSCGICAPLGGVCTQQICDL